ncbi:SHOCT domain-containing protein [Flavobacterium macrobrachii]|uniref:SHOCT domain-containing protein n=1 Tax=Flavobacterium macrobrachii TaxID=591204 RepID=A0ABS2CXS7_9FLAO|nr:SHOCT domain-containing protein [Flavobacterium macrobrachii]MBM6499759.1 SHOCT domain-containing protein [Flavobacterium macrobrachii]
MDDKIAVGILVGLATGTSLYVWNSDRFTKPQKIGLVCCIIFPPLQWIAVLLVLAYNKYQSENTTEAKITKQNVESKQNLDSAKNNLKELKEKGIITEEEFNSKVDKIESQKTAFDIKNSTEYKQLKSLLDSGILTKEEFESKLKLIGSAVEKEVDISEVNNILNSVNKTYLTNLEDNSENNKKENSNNTFVYIFIVITVVLLSILIISQNIENNVEQNYDSPTSVAIDSSAYENVNTNYNYQEPIKNKKFVYVVMKIEKPILDVYEPTGYTNSFGFYEKPDPIYSINYEKETYTTDIIEISDYNIDEKYRVLDDAKNKIYSKLKFVDDAFSTNLWINCKDDNKRKEFKGLSSKITDSQIFEFDKYSEASIHKQNNLE